MTFWEFVNPFTLFSDWSFMNPEPMKPVFKKPRIIGGGECPGDPDCPGQVGVKPSPRMKAPTEPSPGSTYYTDSSSPSKKCETGFFYSDCEVDYMKVAVVVVGAFAFVTMFSKKRMPALIGEQQYFSRR